MVRWCACVSCGTGTGKSGMAVGRRQNRWPRVGSLGVWSRIFVLEGIGAYLRVVYERGC
jgi:hypothetical protein